MMKPIVMKKSCNYIFLLCLICATYLFNCSDYSNPYLDKSRAKIVLKNLSEKKSDTVSIFSRDSIAVEVYLREYLSHFTLNIKNNRYWTDTTIRQSTFNKNKNRFLFSFYDTGWHDINLTSFFSNGDSTSDNIRIFAKSPLKQDTLKINAGYPALLNTSPVNEEVFYVWDLHDTLFKENGPTIQHTFNNAPASSVGELYVIDNNNNRSPSSFFVIKSESINLLRDGNITSMNESVKNDTIYSTTPTFRFIGKITGISGIKIAKINDSLCEKNISDGPRSHLFYYLFQNVDILSPYQIIIDITDNFDKTYRDTMMIKYTQLDISRQ